MTQVVVLSDSVGAVVVVELDGPARRQLVALLEELPRLCRANGARMALQLVRLATELHRTTPQERSTRDSEASKLDASSVRLLHDLDETGDLLGGLSRDSVERLVRTGPLPARFESDDDDS